MYCQCYACRFYRTNQFMLEYPETASPILWDVINRATDHLHYNFLNRLGSQFPGPDAFGHGGGVPLPPYLPDQLRYPVIRPQPLYPNTFDTAPIAPGARCIVNTPQDLETRYGLSFGHRHVDNAPAHYVDHVPHTNTFNDAPRRIPVDASPIPELIPIIDLIDSPDPPQTHDDQQGTNNQQTASGNQLPVSSEEAITPIQKLVVLSEKVDTRKEATRQQQSNPSGRIDSIRNEHVARSEHEPFQYDGLIKPQNAARHQNHNRNLRSDSINPPARSHNIQIGQSTGEIRGHRTTRWVNRWHPFNMADDAAVRNDDNPPRSLPLLNNPVNSTSQQTRSSLWSARPLHAPTPAWSAGVHPNNHTDPPGRCSRCPDHSADHSHADH